MLPNTAKGVKHGETVHAGEREPRRGYLISVSRVNDTRADWNCRNHWQIIQSEDFFNCPYTFSFYTCSLSQYTMFNFLFFLSHTKWFKIKALTTGVSDWFQASNSSQMSNQSKSNWPHVNYKN